MSVEVTCAFCGKGFQTTDRKKKYCGWDCHLQVIDAKAQERKAKAKPKHVYFGAWGILLPAGSLDCVVFKTREQAREMVRTMKDLDGPVDKNGKKWVGTYKVLKVNIREK